LPRFEHSKEGGLTTSSEVDGVIHPAQFRNITANPRDPLIHDAKHVGIIQSLIVTCRLHGIDPYTYLVDVLAARG
jgi:hypothetical protein